MCRTGCPNPGSHDSWGECARAANLRIAYCGVAGLDRDRQNRWDAELSAYRDARAQGIQPDGTTMPKIRAAVEASQRVGAAYGRDFAVASPVEAE